MVKPKQHWLGMLVVLIIMTFFLLGCTQNKPETINKNNPEIINESNSEISDKNIPEITDESDTQPLNNQVDLSNLPKFVHHNFIELDKISKISKFRSATGHDFSNGINETGSCRSMKHYFEPIGIDDAFWQKMKKGKVSKSDFPTVKYFAPVPGIIVDMRPATNMFGDQENQFILQSTEYPNINFLFFHVITDENLQLGSKVEAGDFLGTISPGNSGEIGVSVNLHSNEQLVSFFELIDNSVFSKYQARGVKSRQDFIISKEERDKKPLKCDPDDPEKFIGNWLTSNKEEYDTWSMGLDNWVFLK